MKKEYVSQQKNVHILGRTTVTDRCINLFWTASGLEFHIAASQLWIEFISDYTTMEPWISVEVNGCVVSRQMLVKGTHRVCIFRNMSPNTPKHIRILKDTQAMSGDENALLQIGTMEHDGRMLPFVPHKRRIEFIGDSITSGEGAIGAVCEEDWISMFFSAFHNYAVLTADQLDADFRVVSQSGWGVLSSWDNNPNCALPDYYQAVCGVLPGERNERLGAAGSYSFQGWQPDVVVINLGANDGTAFHQPPWTDGIRQFGQRLNVDGTYKREDVQRLQRKVVWFLELVRVSNPNAHIVWVYGMIPTDIFACIKQAVGQVLDPRLSLLELPPVTSNTMGARRHPGAANHRQAAQVLADHLRSLLK